MAITSDDLLGFATGLVSSDKEVDLRNCAGRAYYAAYHACEPVALELADAPGHIKGVHAQRSYQLSNPHPTPKPDDARRKIVRAGLLLRSLHDRRVTADYHLDETFDQVAANEALETAQKIIECLQAKEVAEALGTAS